MMAGIVKTTAEMSKCVPGLESFGGIRYKPGSLRFSKHPCPANLLRFPARAASFHPDRLRPMRPMSRRQFTRWAMIQALLGGASGCGTILYPERRGQPAGPLDWKIVALDAVGLLLFFVPGVIAFAVDFTTGTIYLPSESYGQKATRGQNR